MRTRGASRGGEEGGKILCEARGGGTGQLAGEAGSAATKRQPKTTASAAPLFPGERKKRMISRGGFATFQTSRG